MDLLKDSVKKLYFRYLFPSMGSAVVASVYLMTDAVVIGKGIGDNALAALFCSVCTRVREMMKKQTNALPLL